MDWPFKPFAARWPLLCSSFHLSISERDLLTRRTPPIRASLSPHIDRRATVNLSPAASTVSWEVKLSPALHLCSLLTSAVPMFTRHKWFNISGPPWLHYSCWGRPPVHRERRSAPDGLVTVGPFVKAQHFVFLTSKHQMENRDRNLLVPFVCVHAEWNSGIIKRIIPSFFPKFVPIIKSTPARSLALSLFLARLQTCCQESVCIRVFRKASRCHSSSAYHPTFRKKIQISFCIF